MPTAQPDRRRIRAQLDAYFTRLPSETRRALKQIRSAIKTAAPKAVEHYGYGTILFPLSEKVPVALVKKIVKARVREVRAS